MEAMLAVVPGGLPGMRVGEAGWADGRRIGCQPVNAASLLQSTAGEQTRARQTVAMSMLCALRRYGDPWAVSVVGLWVWH